MSDPTEFPLKLPEAPPLRGVLLGLDHGAKVIGVARCDASWIVTRPLGLLVRTTRAADFAAINDLVAENHAVGIVVGLPQPPPGLEGTTQADTVRRWSTRLAAAVEVPIYLWDETLSSFEAETLAAEAGLDENERIDDRAAAVILQSFIDAHQGRQPIPMKRERKKP